MSGGRGRVVIGGIEIYLFMFVIPEHVFRRNATSRSSSTRTIAAGPGGVLFLKACCTVRVYVVIRKIRVSKKDSIQTPYNKNSIKQKSSPRTWIIMKKISKQKSALVRGDHHEENLSTIKPGRFGPNRPRARRVRRRRSSHLGWKKSRAEVGRVRFSFLMRFRTVCEMVFLLNC